MVKSGLIILQKVYTKVDPSIVKSSLEYIKASDGLLTSKCLDCNETSEKKFDENLSERFKNIYQFYDGEIYILQ